MRIKKHGNKYKGEKDLPQFEKFKCDKCGCEFSCEPDEYYVDLGGAECNSSYLVSNTYTWSTIVKDYLVCSCPECHKIVKKIKERKNDLTWTSSLSSPNITLKTTNTNPSAETNSIEGITSAYDSTLEGSSNKTKSLFDELTSGANEAATFTFSCKRVNNDEESLE